MRLRLALLALALLILGSDAAAATAESNARLAELVESIRTASGAPALVASVVSSRGTLATAATGNIAVGEDSPVTVNSRFHLGSTGRVMTGALAAALAGRGELRVSGPALLRRSELGAHADWDALTMRDLLSNRAGLPAWMPIDAALVAKLEKLDGTPMEQRRAVVKELLYEGPSGPIPTAQAVPSNAGYIVAGHLLEASARIPFEALIEKLVFVPLGLRSCEVGGPSGAGDAQPHSAGNGAIKVNAGGARKTIPALVPVGDVSCSVRDLGRFAAAHLRGLALAGKPERSVVVYKETRIVALRNTLGWTADRTGPGRDVYTVVGGDAHYAVLIALFPDDDRALVVMTNVGEPAGKAVVVKATQAIRNRYGF